MSTTVFEVKKMTYLIAGVMAEATSTRSALERLFVDGQEIRPEASQKIRNHSPGGFSWGYAGSGPTQTALAICLHIFQNSSVAEAIYQEFKFAFVTRWPIAQPFNEEIDITNFLLDHWEAVSSAYQHSQNVTDTYET